MTMIGTFPALAPRWSSIWPPSMRGISQSRRMTSGFSVRIGERMVKEINAMEGTNVPFGILDITLYRDDLTTIAPQPVVKPTKLPEPIDDKVVVLVDDVLYTGRTVRAALDALIDFGRPRKVMLAVLVDRGHRELPIHADVIGKTVPTDANEVIKVKLVETDGEDEVLIMEK